MTDELGEIPRFRGPVQQHRADAELELRSGRKTSHWMWFMFPQLRELGHSPTAVRYGIVDLDEAVRYLADDELGTSYASLVEVVHQQVVVGTARLTTLFDEPDDLKLVSSLTLFAAAAERLGRLELSTKCRDILRVAERQGYAPCAVTEQHLADRPAL